MTSTHFRPRQRAHLGKTSLGYTERGDRRRAQLTVNGLVVEVGSPTKIRRRFNQLVAFHQQFQQHHPPAPLTPTR